MQLMHKSFQCLRHQAQFILPFHHPVVNGDGQIALGNIMQQPARPSDSSSDTAGNQQNYNGSQYKQNGSYNKDANGILTDHLVCLFHRLHREYHPHNLPSRILQRGIVGVIVTVVDKSIIIRMLFLVIDDSFHNISRCLFSIDLLSSLVAGHGCGSYRVAIIQRNFNFRIFHKAVQHRLILCDLVLSLPEIFIIHLVGSPVQCIISPDHTGTEIPQS